MSKYIIDTEKGKCVPYENYSSYSEGYEQGRVDAERDFQNSDYWNDYLAKVIVDAKVAAYEDAEKRLRYLWDKYESDKENVPKPQFTEAIALITMLELDEEEKSND